MWLQGRAGAGQQMRPGDRGRQPSLGPLDWFWLDVGGQDLMKLSHRIDPHGGGSWEMGPGTSEASRAQDAHTGSVHGFPLFLGPRWVEGTQRGGGRGRKSGWDISKLGEAKAEAGPARAGTPVLQ